MKFTLYNHFYNRLTKATARRIPSLVLTNEPPTGYTRIKKGLLMGLNWLLPDKCIQCKQALKLSENQPVCTACYPTLPLQASICQRCAQPYTGLTDYCGRCLTAPPYFDACFCPFEYKTPISDLIICFKYQQTPGLAQKLARLIAAEIELQNVTMPDLLVPVPMHNKRLRQRGYNQSSLLAQQLGRLLEIPVDYGALRKIRHTEQQTQKTLKQRKNNVLGSFSLRKNISVKSIAIIDDVVTTGSTAGEIAKILKKNGVDYIQVWGIAHTL